MSQQKSWDFLSRMPFQRASGILLHPTSLPSRGGIGDLGPAAYAFVDFLAAARQTLWQVLPLGPVGTGNSPYSAISAFAGNPLLISIERLVDKDWLRPSALKKLGVRVGPVNYESVYACKIPLLQEAARNFLRESYGESRARYERFCQENAWWLDDFALFTVLRQQHNQQSWQTWPRTLARREPDALDKIRKDYREALQVEHAIQFAFFEQWRALHSYCRQRRIKIVGDVAIFVNLDSADVWEHREIFHLNDKLEPVCVAGVPPDFFSKTGQRWGNPLYRWDVLKSRGYDWWIERMRWVLNVCDVIRLDHFRGFEAYWEIPGHEATAVNGRWVKGPEKELFHALRNSLGDLPFIAEDLGIITAEVERLRDDLGLPGMRILQFGFSDRGAHIYLPHRFEKNTVVYTGTHDNDTTLGWWNNVATGAERAAVESYLRPGRDGIAWAFIRAALTSVADLCVIPLQDVLNLDSDARMNIPSKSDGNWSWRFSPSALKPEVAQQLADLTQIADRDPGLDADQHSHGEAREDFAA
jgi:4-alpha-glucanotransferase